MAGPDGVPTSLATEQTVEEGIARIKPGDMLVLTPLLPLFLPSGEECLYIACEQDAGADGNAAAFRLHTSR